MDQGRQEKPKFKSALLRLLQLPSNWSFCFKLSRFHGCFICIHFVCVPLKRFGVVASAFVHKPDRPTRLADGIPRSEDLREAAASTLTYKPTRGVESQS